jgi:hypothetical protein
MRNSPVARRVSSASWVRIWMRLRRRGKSMPISPRKNAQDRGDYEQACHNQPLDAAAVLIGIVAKDRLDLVLPKECQKAQRRGASTENGLQRETQTQSPCHDPPNPRNQIQHDRHSVPLMAMECGTFMDSARGFGPEWW